MAKFFYRMQNILDIKYKLEESAKQEYSEARRLLNIEEEKLEGLKARQEAYYREYNDALNGRLDFLKIEECKTAIDIIKDMIERQEEVIRARSRALEKARQKMAEAMQERKMHEKLKEKKFEEFKHELAAEENKEIDEVVSYQYNSREE